MVRNHGNAPSHRYDRGAFYLVWRGGGITRKLLVHDPMSVQVPREPRESNMLVPMPSPPVPQGTQGTSGLHRDNLNGLRNPSCLLVRMRLYSHPRAG